MIYTPYVNQIINLIAAKTKTMTGSGFCYLGFSSTTPNDDGSNFTEPDATTYPSYARIQLNVYSAMPYADVFGTAADGRISNIKELVTTQCKEESGWPDLTHWGIFTTETASTPILGDWICDPEGEVDDEGNYPHKTLTVPYKEVGIIGAGAVIIGVK